MSHVSQRVDYELSPETATDTSLDALEYAHLYDRPAHLFESAWRHFEGAHWLVEHELRGNHRLIDVHQTAVMYQNGIETLTRSVSKSEDQQNYHRYINTLMAHRAIRWFCVDRLYSQMPVYELYDAYLNDIANSLKVRHERSQHELSDPTTTDRRKNTIYGDYGYLIEAMLLGVLAESEEFRRASIIGLPATPSAEKGSNESPVPPDIMLWEIRSDNTAVAIGGIQVKSSRSGPTLDPRNFTATFVARNNQDLRNSQEIVSDWLAGENLEDTHYRLLMAILRSGNVALINALGINAQLDYSDVSVQI